MSSNPVFFFSCEQLGLQKAPTCVCTTRRESTRGEDGEGTHRRGEGGRLPALTLDVSLMEMELHKRGKENAWDQKIEIDEYFALTHAN